MYRAILDLVILLMAAAIVFVPLALLAASRDSRKRREADDLRESQRLEQERIEFLRRERDE